MGIEERKEQKRKEMRELILEAARRLFYEAGFARVTIRNIARAIEFSPRTIYLYFPNKDSIVRAIQEDGFKKLYAKLAETEWIQEPLDRLKAQGLAYVMFALRNPEHYNLMFSTPNSRPQTARTPSGMDLSQESNLLLQNTVKECLEKGLIPAADLRLAGLTVWAALHGISTLVGRQAFPGLPEDEQKRWARRGVLYLAQLLKSGGKSGALKSPVGALDSED